MYELIAKDVITRLAPWLWEEFNPEARSQAKFFRKERQISSFQLEELVLEVKTSVANAASTLPERRVANYRNEREYFQYEIDAVNQCLDGLEAFLNWDRSHLDYGAQSELDTLRKLLTKLLIEVRLPSQLQVDMAASKYRSILKPSYLEQRTRDPEGVLISKESNEAAWLNMRKSGLTSSDAGRLIRLNGDRRVGWESLFETKLPGYVAPYFNSYSLGTEREPKIAEWVISNFPEEGFFHNEFTYDRFDNKRLLSTPDLVGDFAVCEIKVSSADLETNLQRYQDQIQWHMMVLCAPVCLFVVENRYDQSKAFEWVKADDHRISNLRDAAEQWLDEFDAWLQERDTL